MIFYNDNDSEVLSVLKIAIEQGYIPDGLVACHDIRAIDPMQLEGYKRIHLFAGIGGWEYACQLAGVPDDMEILTVSCPCQPFSTATTKRKGFEDDRHLWPEAFRIIQERKPEFIFGEQVASVDGREWLGIVSAQLESVGYEVGFAVVNAAMFGAPHKRSRIYFAAVLLEDTNFNGHSGPGRALLGNTADASRGCKESGGQLADTNGGKFKKEQNTGTGSVEGQESTSASERPGSDLGDTGEQGSQGLLWNETGAEGRDEEGGYFAETDLFGNMAHAFEQRFNGEQILREGKIEVVGTGFTHWSECEWDEYRDGKVRPRGRDYIPVECRSFDVVDGTAEELRAYNRNRIARLKGAGNAIVPVIGAEIIKAVMEWRNEQGLK